jgi:hypothetical protein
VKIEKGVRGGGVLRKGEQCKKNYMPRGLAQPWTASWLSYEVKIKISGLFQEMTVLIFKFIGD